MKYEEQRRQVVAIVEELYNAGLITPTGGNVSLRLPGGDGYLITPSGMFKGGLEPEDIVFLDPGGNPDPQGRVPSIETSMHLAVYAVRPGVAAVLHAHSPMATLAGVLRVRIPALTVEAVAFAQLPVVPFVVPGSPELAQAVAQAFREAPVAPAVLLQNHGVVTVGETLRQAANAALALEEVCRLAIMCLLLDREPVEIPPELQETLRRLVFERP